MKKLLYFVLDCLYCGVIMLLPVIGYAYHVGFWGMAAIFFVDTLILDFYPDFANKYVKKYK